MPPPGKELHVSNPTGEHPLRRLLFLVPAIILVATIAIAARLMNNKPVVREAVIPATPAPSLAPATPAPTLAPRPKAFIKPLFSFQYPPELSLLECTDNSMVYLFTPSAESTSDISEFCSNLPNVVVSVYYGTTKLPGESGEVVKTEELEIDGVTASKRVLKSGESEITIVDFEFDSKFYKVKLTGSTFTDALNKVVETFKLKEEDPTKDWETFTNSGYYYKLKYPPEWKVITQISKEEELGPKLEIRKEESETKLHNLIIETQLGIKDVSLTASQTISSTKNLSGWKMSPTAEFRSVGGGNAELIQGQLNGNWSAFVVVWYRDILVQMTWNDNLSQDDQETFENILSTFEFTK